MTNELDKQFFKCFSIEPRYEDACTVEDKYWDNEELANEYGTFDQYMNCKCGDQENCTTECSCAYQKEVYPQITDRILLELICLLADLYDSNSHGYPLLSKDIKELKEDVLDDLMGAIDVENDYPEGYANKVRTLFEEK